MIAERGSMDPAIRSAIDDVIPSGRRVEQKWQQVSRVVLQILVERGHPMPGGVKNAGDGSSVLPEITRQLDDANPGMRLLQLAQDRHRIVDRRVIDEDRFQQLDRHLAGSELELHSL